jgi:YggT family protein
VSAAVLVLATARHEIARYVNALFDVYLICIFAYVLVSIVFSVGIRVPYWRWLHAIFGFLGQVVEPYLRIFRRVLPNLGPLDLSPMVGILLLLLAQGLVVGAIDG